MGNNEFITIKKISELCGISRETVENWIRQEKLKVKILPSGRNKVRVEDYNEFAKKFNMPEMEN